MAHVFISHRAVEADLALARDLRDRLEAASHLTFLAGDSIHIGESWPERVANELARADVMLLLLSPEAAMSEMVIEEVRQARKLRRAKGRPRILPVRVREEPGAPLPYDLGAYLGRLQQMSWQKDGDTEALVAALLHVIEEGIEGAAFGEHREQTAAQVHAEVAEAQLGDDTEAGPPTHRGATPLMAQPAGAPYSPDWYVPQRRALREARAYLRQPGSPVVLVGPYQCGKSWFLHHLVETVREEGDCVVHMNLDHLPDECLDSHEALLMELCVELCDAAGLSEDVISRAWALPAHPLRKLSRLVERRVMPAITGRLLLVIDRADAVLAHDYHGDFFGLLRSWAEVAGRAPWARFRLLAAISTEPSLLVQSANASPFNLSVPIRLGDFDAAQIGELARRHGLNWDTATVKKLMAVIGGQPYLVRLTLFQAANHGQPIDRLLEEAVAEDGLFADHLRSRLLRLRANPELAEAVRRLMDDPATPVDYLVAHRLIRAGVIKGSRGDYRLRYPLYRAFFAGRL